MEEGGPGCLRPRGCGDLLRRTFVGLEDDEEEEGTSWALTAERVGRILLLLPVEEEEVGT